MELLRHRGHLARVGQVGAHLAARAAAHVAEARELRALLGAQHVLGRHLRRHALAHRGEGLLEALLPTRDDLWMLRREIARFLGIGGNVEDARLRRLHEEEVAVGERAQRVPLVGEERQEALAVAPAVAALTDRRQRQQRAAVDARPRRHAGELQQRRREVDRTHQALLVLAGGDAGAGEDERHAPRAVAEQQPVAELSLIAEHLAVVADDGDVRFLGQRGEQPADLVVHVGDLGVVEAVRARRAVGPRRRRPVLLVRIEVVHPEKPRRAQLAERGERGIGRRPRLPLAHLGTGAVAGAEVVVVGREALVEAVAARQHDRGDDGRAVVAGAAQRLGDRLEARLQHEGAVVAHAVPRRVETGEHRGVADEGDRRHRVAAHEASAAAREGVEVRRPRLRPTPGAEVVGAGGVERDEDEVRPRSCGAQPRVAAASASNAATNSSRRASLRGRTAPTECPDKMGHRRTHTRADPPSPAQPLTHRHPTRSLGTHLVTHSSY